MISKISLQSHTGSSEEFFMILLIFAKKFFCAKFKVSFVSNPFFYLGFIVTELIFSITAVFIIYFFYAGFILFSSFRKKKVMTVIATVFLSVFCNFYGFMNSSVSMSSSNPKFINDNLGKAIDKLNSINSSILYIYIFLVHLKTKIPNKIIFKEELFNHF